MLEKSLWEELKELTGSGVEVEEQENLTVDPQELYADAVALVFETQEPPSVVLLQKELKLSYAAAAQLMAQMEEDGLVSAFDREKPRQLLMTRDEWLHMPTACGGLVEPGEVYELDRSYMVTMVVEYQGYEYAYFVTTEEPYQVKFGKLLPYGDRDDFDVEIVHEQELKYTLLDLFVKKGQEMLGKGE